jgi:hypothetical protein
LEENTAYLQGIIAHLCASLQDENDNIQHKRTQVKIWEYALSMFNSQGIKEHQEKP